MPKSGGMGERVPPATAMRLSQQHREAIRRVVADAVGPAATVRLFGSRVDDSKRGGDVDLLIEMPVEPSDVFALQRRLSARLLRVLDSRPVDVLVIGPATPRETVHEEALRHGVLL